MGIKILLTIIPSFFCLLNMFALIFYNLDARYLEIVAELEVRRNVVLRYRAVNPGRKPVQVTVVGSLSNAVGASPGIPSPARSERTTTARCLPVPGKQGGTCMTTWSTWKAKPAYDRARYI